MSRPDEKASPACPRPVRFLLVLVLACAAPLARAQTPSCAWGSGVTLPGGDSRALLITDDGGSGVIAIVWPVISGFMGPVYGNSLHFFHVLEQGTLDPNLPADGVPIISAPDLPSHSEFAGARVLSDGVGGAYLLFRACNSTMAHMRCYEVLQMRLLHLTAQGTIAPGWPALGVLLPPIYGFPDVHAVADIVPDGDAPVGTPHGVIAAWLDESLQFPPVSAQRFAPDGGTLWPGGLAGVEVLAGQATRYSLCVAGDHAGGASVVATQLVSGSTRQLETRAGRVLADGSVPWGAAGKPVVTQPTYSVSAQALTMDDQGRSFVTLDLTSIAYNPERFATQLLNAQGARAWGLFGIELGSIGYNTSASGLATPAGFVSLHTDAAGSPRYQQQDEYGSAIWGDTSDGIPADWTTPPSGQLPLTTAEGHVVTVWQSREGPPNSGIRALELDEDGGIVPGWPATGVAMCDAAPASHNLSDAMISGGNLFVAFGSAEYSGVLPAIQRLSRAVLGARADLPARPIELSTPAPNPARGAWLARLALREAGSVSLEAFDVAGRRVLAVDLGVLPAGRHALAVPGGAELAPGVYRLRARSGNASAERMLVKVR
ncbi:MAG TPA: hypothetical protein VN896_02385 [Methylomirabilota bacterium]|nr:hypothetical protein [Methylomirabilota bacterium]